MYFFNLSYIDINVLSNTLVVENQYIIVFLGIAIYYIIEYIKLVLPLPRFDYMKHTGYKLLITSLCLLIRDVFYVFNGIFS